MFAIKTPIIAPAICKITKLTKVLNDIYLFKKNTQETTGLK